jgi:hypothetical protein
MYYKIFFILLPYLMNQYVQLFMYYDVLYLVKYMYCYNMDENGRYVDRFIGMLCASKRIVTWYCELVSIDYFRMYLLL